MNLSNGAVRLLQSPSGVFSLLCFIALVVLTWHLGTAMVAAWAAFFGICPAALGYFEHKETLAQMAQPTTVTTVIDNIKGRI